MSLTIDLCLTEKNFRHCPPRTSKRDFSSFPKLEVQALVTADLERTEDNARMRQITGGHAADMTKLLQTLRPKAP
jgi:hypothetical protein